MSSTTTLKATALASFVAIRSHAAKLADKYRAVAYDVTTPKGMAAAKDARLELREEGRFAVQRLRDRLKDEANDLKRVVTDEAEAVIKIIAPVEDAIHAQITAEEERKKAEKAEAARILAERQAKQADGVAGIRAYLSRAQTAADMTAERVGNGIAMLTAMTFAADHWLDPVAAANAQCETLEGMRALHSTLLAREEAAAAAEAQRLENERVAAELERQVAAMRAEQARIARLTAMIAEIRAAATGHVNATAHCLVAARAEVAAVDVSEKVYQEFAPLAQAAQMATLAVLDKFHLEVVDREAAEAKRAADLQEAAAAAKAMADAIAAAELTIPAEPAAADVVTTGTIHVDPETGDQSRITLVVSEPLPEPTMTLGDINAWLAPLKIDGAGLELLGFPAAGRRKAAMLYHDTDRPAMVAAMVKHLQGL